MPETQAVIAAHPDQKTATDIKRGPATHLVIHEPVALLRRRHMPSRHMQQENGNAGDPAELKGRSQKRESVHHAGVIITPNYLAPAIGTGTTRLVALPLPANTCGCWPFQLSVA